MRLIVKPRQTGKTSELIRMSEETNAYIITLNWGMAEYVSKMAKAQGHNIPYPIALNDYMRTGFKDSNVKHILIDNADMVLQHIFSEATIDAITMSEQEPTVQEEMKANRTFIDALEDIANGIVIPRSSPIDVLREIRQEIAESKYNHRGEYNRELVFNICLQIIDSKIKELKT